MAIPGITIRSGPQDWQILQRDARGEAALELRLEGDPAPHGPGAAVQARVVEEATGAPPTRDLNWRSAVRDGDAWRLRLDGIPVGGTYRIETRLARPQNTGDRRALRGDCRHHLAVGDLWLIAGQSNASGTGKGAASDPPELGLHQLGNDERWRLATHPLEDATGTRHPITITSIFHGHSPWLAFARRLRARTGVPIGLIPTALGGSPMGRWIRDDGTPGDLTANLLEMARLAGGRVAGIVWYQGESDAFDQSGAAVAAYARRFAAWSALVRQALGDSALPLITVQLHAFDGGDAGMPARWQAIRELQRRLAHELPRTALVPASDVVLSDEVHNSAAGNVMIGERCAEAALALAHGLPVAWAWPEAVAAAWTAGRHELELTVAHRSGDWTPAQRIDDITASDAAGPLPVAQVEPGEGIRIRLARPAGPGARVHINAGLHPVPTLRDDAGRCLVSCTLDLPD